MWLHSNTEHFREGRRGRRRRRAGGWERQRESVHTAAGGIPVSGTSLLIHRGSPALASRLPVAACSSDLTESQGRPQRNDFQILALFGWLRGNDWGRGSSEVFSVCVHTCVCLCWGGTRPCLLVPTCAFGGKLALKNAHHEVDTAWVHRGEEKDSWE